MSGPSGRSYKFKRKRRKYIHILMNSIIKVRKMIEVRIEWMVMIRVFE